MQKLVLPIVVCALMFGTGCEYQTKEFRSSFKEDHVIAAVDTDHVPGGIGLAAADYDGDGDIDLISVKHLDKGKIILYENDGRGNYHEKGQIGQVPCDYYGIGLAAADFDKDGDIDLAIIKNSGDGGVVLYKNDGTGIIKE